MKKLLIFGALFLLIACGEKPDTGEKDTEREITVLAKHEVIYELNVRNFSPQGNLAGVTAEIPRLKELGIDILWLMPIHPIGVQNRTGSKGSPYSVKNYYEINPDFGTAADLKELVATAHSNGIKIIIDWVANHTAWDNVWVSEHIDYYLERDGQRPVAAGTGGQIWNDVAQLDWNNSEMRSAMIAAMQYWVQEFDIDGFRCDYVSGVPVSFWEQAKAAIEPIKELFWLAESDDSKYMDVFDCDYAWGFSDRMNDFASGKNLSALRSACNTLFNNTAYTNKSKMVYITNHDVNVADGTEFSRFQGNVFNMTVLFFTIYDMPLLYNGQEIGANKTMGLFDVSSVPWNISNQKMKTLVKDMVDLKHSQPALENGAGRGTLTFYNTDKNSDILVYSRKKGNNEVLVILNFAGNAINFKFTGTAPQGTFTDWLVIKNPSEKQFNTTENVTVAANGFQVWIR